ncbi:MAG: glycine zipper 2TM domain-containing protein [Nitrospiraceae bacterium]|nr:MAG: glycine zipper 2TM domain-containing protein [Nitrospiraceae bacterium]
MKKILSIFMVLAVLTLAVGCTQYHARGAGVGGAVGGAAGVLLDKKNRWRGGVIGAVLGAIAGASLTEVSMQASQEAARQNRPVEYRTTDGRGQVQAYPLDYNAETKCHKVQERVWEDGKLIKDEIKEVCEGHKTEQKY